MKSQNRIQTVAGAGRNSQSLRKLAAGVSGAVLLSIAGPTLAADAITSRMDVTAPAKTLSTDEWRSISLASTNLLKQADKAIDALASKKNDVAQKDIADSLKLVKIIDAALPFSTVKTEIEGGGLTYQDEDQVKPVFVPIYREFDTVDVLSPVAARKQDHTVGKGGKEALAKAETVPEFTYAGFDYTGIKLDLRMAKRNLQWAQDLAKKNDVKAATSALQDISTNGLIFEFSTVDEPLVRAMDNLRLAQSELKNKHADEAKAALAGAVDALNNYEKIAGEGCSKETGKLYKEIEEVRNNIARENQETISKSISGWWGKLQGWLKKAV